MVYLSKRDSLPFSQLTDEECKSILSRFGTDLNKYTVGQIQEMVLVKGSVDGSLIFCPNLMITSAEGHIINTGISAEALSKWNNT